MSASVPLLISRMPPWLPKPWRSSRWVTGGNKTRLCSSYWTSVCQYINMQFQLQQRAILPFMCLYRHQVKFDQLYYVLPLPGCGAGEQQVGDEVPRPLDPADPALHRKDQPRAQLQRCRNTADLSFHRVLSNTHVRCVSVRCCVFLCKNISTL